MTYELDRRSVIKGVAAGTVTLSYAGPVTAARGRRYLVLVENPGVQRRVENAGFSIQHTLADGTALLAIGPSNKRDKLEDTNGVQEVAADAKFQLDAPIQWEMYERSHNRRNGSDNGKGKGAGGDKGSKNGGDESGPESEESSDDELFPLQWDKHELTTDAVTAHERATGVGTSIAIIDTGVDIDGHPDLPNVDASAGRLFREGQVKSGTGAVEFPNDIEDLEAGTTTITDHVADDVYYHGTHVAGIAGASRDGTTGIVGTAPDTTLVPLRVFYWMEIEGTAALVTTTADILLAIDHAASIGVDAMNLSIGTDPIPPSANRDRFRPIYQRIIESAVRRGSVVVVSAGNSGADLQSGFFTVPNSVAGAMSISATGPNDELVFYSNFGTNEVSVGAPGGGYETEEKTFEEDSDVVDWPYPTNFVLSTSDPDSLVGQLSGGALYLYAAGTSMAAPQVAGAAALVREVAPEATAKQVEKAIEQGAEHVDGEGDNQLGAGRLNCNLALDADVIN